MISFCLCNEDKPSSTKRVMSVVRLLPRMTGTPCSTKKRLPIFEPDGPETMALEFGSATSPSVDSRQFSGRTSVAMPKLLQVDGDSSIQLRGFALLRPQRRNEALHFFSSHEPNPIGRFL